MATASIPLAKGLDLSKMEWPAYLSIKKDGVPIKITINKLQDCYSYTAVSRDNKPLGGCAGRRSVCEGPVNVMDARR